MALRSPLSGAPRRYGPWRMEPLLFLYFLFLAAGTASSLAQSSGPPDSPDANREIVTRMESLDRTLAEIADAMREIRRDQRVLVLARWIELEERLYATMEEDLRRALAEKRALEEASREQEIRLETFKEAAQKEIREGADPDRIPTQTVVESLEAALKLNRANAEQAAARALELEGALVGPRRELQKLRDRLRDWMDAVED